MADAAGGPEFHRRKVGEIEVLSLRDGRSMGSVALFPAGVREDATALATAAGFDPGAIPIEVLVFAIRCAGRTILVDTGTGKARGDRLGHAGAALAAAGIAAGDVDTVFLTHLHGDHAGGLLDDEGRPAFPRATLLVAEAERAFWADPHLAERSPERMQATIATAGRALAAWEGRIHTFEGNVEVAPGVTTVALPGHTPGQTGLLIESGGELLLLFADIFHIPAIQAPRPDWPVGFDVDGAGAVATRRAVLERIVAEDLAVAGMHLPFPGFGRVTRAGDAYAYEGASA